MTQQHKDYPYRAINIQMGEGLKTDRNGNAYLTGTFQHKRDDGTLRTYVFKAFDRTFPGSGKRIEPATEMWTKLREMGQGVLIGNFRPGRGNYKDFHVAFARTEDEHRAIEANRAAARRAAREARAAEAREADAH
jgi:hypothetical protein